MKEVDNKSLQQYVLAHGIVFWGVLDNVPKDGIGNGVDESLSAILTAADSQLNIFDKYLAIMDVIANNPATFSGITIRNITGEEAKNFINGSEALPYGALVTGIV